MKGSESNTCTEEELNLALLQNGVNLTPEEKELVTLQLYKKSNRLDMLPYKQLHEIFDPAKLAPKPTTTNIQFQENDLLKDIDGGLLDDEF
jgi:hypothetical protein